MCLPKELIDADDDAALQLEPVLRRMALIFTPLLAVELAVVVVLVIRG